MLQVTTFSRGRIMIFMSCREDSISLITCYPFTLLLSCASQRSILIVPPVLDSVKTNPMQDSFFYLSPRLKIRFHPYQLLGSANCNVWLFAISHNEHLSHDITEDIQELDDQLFFPNLLVVRDSEIQQTLLFINFHQQTGVKYKGRRIFFTRYQIACFTAFPFSLSTTEWKRQCLSTWWYLNWKLSQGWSFDRR